MANKFSYIVAAGVIGMALLVPHTASAKCRNQIANFGDWLADFKREAVAAGVRRSVVDRALAGVRYDPGVVRKDRAQHVFSQTFLQFATRMVERYRVGVGRRKLRANRALFNRIQRRFGVPGEVVTAFWGLETDFGAFLGKSRTLQSLATLAFDCRRTDLFHKQLISALKIIQRGDLRPSQMRGPWAGELGQLQFLPSHYLDYGVDFDGDGHVNLIRSRADVLASGANFLRHLGWKPGQPWLREVSVPARMKWREAGLDIRHPVSQWQKWGVRARDGRRLPGRLQASLLLPMGRNGPAFLAFDNFQVFLEWNQSLVYSTTAAYYATRLAGARRMSSGRGPIDGLSYNQIKALQRILKTHGHHVGKVDGIIGERTREAVRKEQIRLGLPADSYPTRGLLARLR